MKKFILKLSALAIFVFAFSAIFASRAFAMSPTLTLSSYATTVNSVQISVYGDPNSSVSLEYQGSYGFQNEGTIGTTNSGGYFSTNLNPTSYLIPTGSEVFVTVDGQQSQYVPWPNLSSENYNYEYPTTNYNYAYPAAYTYPSQNYSYQVAPSSPLSLSSTTTTISPNQSQSIQIYETSNYNSYEYPYTNNSYNSYNYNNYETGSYYISTNQNPNVASATVNGSTLEIYGISQGSTNVTVCQSNSADGSPSCGTVLVTVTAPYQYYNNYSYGNYYNEYPNSYNYSYPTYY